MSSTLLKSDFNSATPSLPARRKERKGGRVTQVVERVGEWFQARLNRVDSRRLPKLQLEFPDRFVNFRSMREFEFALSSRTDFPAARVRDLITLTPAELESSATKIRQVERDFAEVLARGVHHPELIGEYFRELEIKLFSQDHGWRETMEGLIRLSPAFDAYKRVALIKYMQYLRSRQNIMRSLFVEKTSGDRSASVHATRAGEDDTQFAPHETAIFDLTQVATAPANSEAPDAIKPFTPLPKGETVRLHLGSDREVVLMLAGNRLRLYTGREFYMVDDGNNTFPLHAGKNLVGRHSVCDVALDAACRAVSRNHLIVQPVSEQEVLLTDLSSHGTEVPTRYLTRH